MRADDELIRCAKHGDAHAWRELYRAHAGRLVLWLGTRPSGDAAVSREDLAAEAWLTAAEKIAQFSGTSDEFAGWLFGIARNLAANARRRTLRRATDPESDPAASTLVGSPEVEFVAFDRVQRILATLPPREREVVACLDVVGLDVNGTAHALGISSVAVRVTHHRALRRLRNPRLQESIT